MLTRQEVKNRLEEYASHCNDEEKLQQDFTYTPHGWILSETQGDLFKPAKVVPVELTLHAESQLLQRVKIPVSYFRRCPVELREGNANYWLRHLKPQRKLVLRKHRQQVRAVLTTRFSPMDDLEVIPPLLEKIPQAGIREFYKGEEITTLRLYLPEAIVKHRNHKYEAFLTIINSEVGSSRLTIKPTILLNSRTYISDSSSEGTTNIVHVGQLKEEMVEKGLEKAIEVSQTGIAHLIKASTEVVEDPLEVVESLTHRSSIPSAIATTMVNRGWDKKERTSKLELAQEILEAVQELPTFSEKRRLEAEMQMGRYLNLFKNTKKRLAKILSKKTSK